jgi:hypothetical protein
MSEVARFFGENDSPLDAARAVLALIRSEQENNDRFIDVHGIEKWWERQP